MRKSVALLLLPLVMAGCIGPRPEPPLRTAVVPPPGWRAAQRTTMELQLDWWKGFDDPVLSSLIERALAQNTDIGQAAARVDYARSLARLARANRAPLVDFTASGTYTRDKTGPVTIQSATLAPLVTASWDTDLFGQLRDLSASGRASLLASAASRDAIALSTASSTATGYITLLSLDAQLAVQRSTLVLRAESLHIAKRQADTGYTSLLEYYQALAEYETAQAAIPGLQRSISVQEHVLNVLVGDNPGPIPRGRLLGKLRPPGIPQGLPSELLRRRPDIFAAEETLVAADYTLDSSRAAMLPQLTLSGTAGPTFNAFGPTSRLFEIAGNILAPIFDGGRLRSAADGSAALRDEAAYSYRGTVLLAFQEVEDALVSIRRYNEQQVAYARLVDTSTRGVRIATERYREGYSPYLDQLDQQRTLLTSQLALIQAETSRLSNYVLLYEAMGGGWYPSPVQLLNAPRAADLRRAPEPRR